MRTIGILCIVSTAVGLGLQQGWAQSSGTQPAAATNIAEQWLGTTGKSEGWVQATQDCRRMLSQLDLTKDLVRPYMPNLRRQTEMLRRVDSFNWRTITAVEFLRNALEDLLADKVPNKRYAGTELAFPYWSDRLQRIEATWMHVPPEYDPAKEYQVFLYYKSGGGIFYHEGKAAGGYRPTIEMANKTDTFHAWSSLNIQVKGRLGLDIELAEFPPALAREFSVSPDRVFLTGYSDGGFSALWLATHYPHLVAGLAPSCANWQYTNVEQANLLNTPYLVVDGWDDGGYIETNFLRGLTLANMGYNVSAVFGQHGHTHAPYESEKEFKHILDWAKSKKRDLWPKHVRYATWNLTWPRAYWLTIERMNTPYLPAQIEAQVKNGNVIDVKTWNIAAYKVFLDEKLIDAAKPVTVMTDGKKSYSGPCRSDLLIELAPRPAGKFAKTASMPDDITAQIVAGTYDGKPVITDRSWLAIKGTLADEEATKTLANWFPKDARSDIDVSDQDLSRCNLFLYGGPEINKVTARIAGDLPIKFGNKRFTIGRTTYDQPSECVAFLHPSPLNPSKYVIVYAFNDAARFAENKYFNLADVASAWSFRTGDCVVCGIPAGRDKPGIHIDKTDYMQQHIVFDSAWQADSKIIADLPAPLDRKQILGLRAEAIRNAARADIGIFWEDTPDYLRWTDCLPAGPITLADLATIDALPEYIMVGQMRGQDLSDAHPAATTLAPASGVPSFRRAELVSANQLDPSKTYTVAMGYYGIPAYRTNPKQMPELFTFSSEKEFLANENNTIIVRNLRQIPIDVTEALATHLAKHGPPSSQPAPTQADRR